MVVVVWRVGVGSLVKLWFAFQRRGLVLGVRAGISALTVRFHRSRGCGVGLVI